MDSARQIIRWSIPGSLCILTVCAAYTSLQLALGLQLSEALRPLADNVSPVAAIALSIPIGFLAYHLYDALHRPNRPLSGFVPSNRGGKVLEYLTERQRDAIAAAVPGRLLMPWHHIGEANVRVLAGAGQLDLLCDPFASPALRPAARFTKTLARQEVAPPDGFEEWPSDALKAAVSCLFEARWQAHYHLASVLLDISALGKETTDVKQQWRDASDIYHSLGASRFAIGAGAIIGFIAHVLQMQVALEPPSRRAVLGSLLVALVLLLPLLGLFRLLNRVRAKRFLVSAERLGYGLRVVFSRERDLLEALHDLSPDERRAAATAPRYDRDAKEAVLDEAERDGTPATAIWLTYAHNDGTAADWLAEHEATTGQSRAALLALPSDAFTVALELSHFRPRRTRGVATDAARFASRTTAAVSPESRPG